MICCQGGITATPDYWLASSDLMNGRIASNRSTIWIGGCVECSGGGIDREQSLRDKDSRTSSGNAHRNGVPKQDIFHQ
jgi:hypothetical protein